MNSSDDHLLEDIVAIEDDVENESITNLLDDDIQCGVIFYNETTRVLKFFCTYCEKVSDNINYFCQHLSEHINDNDSERTHEATLLHKNGSEVENYDDDTDCRPIILTSKEAIYDDNLKETLLPCDLAGFDESKMVVEELDEAEEIAAEVEDEMRQELESEILLPRKESSVPEDFYGYGQVNGEHLKEIKKTATDFESVLNMENIHKSNFEAASKKKKRVTTVKVIALKNRVAELYKRIKIEEERRSRVLSPESVIGNVATNIDSVNSMIGVDTEEIDQPIDTEPIRQIIGETVITLLPQATPSKFDISKFAGTVIPQFKPNIKSECLDDKTTCPACGRKFRSAFSLTIHKRTHYLESDSNVKLAHKCSDCDQLFNKIPDLKEHIHEVHYPDGFICKICNRKLTSLTLLETHMRKIHLSRPFNCEICRKNFDTRDRFEEHVKAHVSGQQYRCHICGRKYSTECILKQHLRRHKEQIPQCCVVCGKMTLRITQHMKIHAPRPKKVLSCKVCGKVFNFSSGLSHHYKVMHKLPKLAPKLKREYINSQQIKTELTSDHMEGAKPVVKVQREENTDEINKKEEEAKRVIVELIQNATYTSFFPEHFHSSIDCGPPIAREETISAVNSIVNEENL